MALDIPSLRAITTANLKVLRENYKQQRRQLPRNHRFDSILLPTDVRRCDDAIDIINRVLRARRVNKRPLKDFAS